MSASRFISCEDHLEKWHELHNPVATLSSVIIMGVPLRAMWRAQSCFPNDMPIDVKLYIAAMFLLFYFNLHQHALGGCFPDVDSGGCLYGILQANMLYQGPRKAIVRMVLILMFLGLVGFFLYNPDLNQDAKKLMGAPFSLYVIAVMAKESSKRKIFSRWIFCLASLLFIQATVHVDENYVCGQGNSSSGYLSMHTTQRYFHGVVAHLAIVLLFGASSDLAIDLMKDETKKLA
jgi:hypothetical protein